MNTSVIESAYSYETSYVSISLYSVVMALLVFTIASIALSITLRHSMRGGISCFLFVCVLTLVRLFLPIEPLGSQVIRSDVIYPYMIQLASRSIGFLTVSKWLLMIWGVGSAVSLIRAGWKFFRPYDLRELHILDESDRICSLCVAEAGNMGYKGQMTVYMSPENGTAYLFGFLKPKIVFADVLQELSDEQIRFIARHELSHFLCHDLWIKASMLVVQCALWWNPAVRLLRRSMEQMLELRSDARACRALSEQEQIAYLEMLLLVSKGTEHGTEPLPVSFSGYGASEELYQRFTFITNQQTKPLAAWKAVLCGIACFALFVVSYFVVIQPAYAPPVEEIGPNQVIVTSDNAFLVQTGENSYQFYINGAYWLDVSEEMLVSEPYCHLPIISEDEFNGKE